jgi:hypothetical protein
MDVAVALLIFNRPHVTQRVVDAVAAARPKRLLVIADGPRPDRQGEAERCEATRAIIDRVDWDCEVLKNYSDRNLGVGIRPATGFQWVFQQVDEAIILEDDCVPHPTFFRFCEELLEKYRDDERVMHISGDNWNFGTSPYSYCFGCYCYSCGWATWRRAFQLYDPTVELWPYLSQTSWLANILGDARAAEFWARKFESIHAEGVERNGWDWPWLFACLTHHGLSILPSTNLISNIGFDETATHTKNIDDERANVPTKEMLFPLRHPPYMVRDTEVERRIFAQVGWRPEPQDLYHRLRRKSVDVLPPSLRRPLASFRSRLTSSRQNLPRKGQRRSH